MDDLEVRADLEQRLAVLAGLGERLAECALGSPQPPDPLVVALASQYLQAKRVYDRRRRARLAEVAG